jgi:hypothetical protein
MKLPGLIEKLHTDRHFHAVFTVIPKEPKNLWYCRQCRRGTSALTITGPTAFANGVNLELLKIGQVILMLGECLGPIGAFPVNVWHCSFAEPILHLFLLENIRGPLLAGAFDP